ncbi:uncharacterized protein N7473_000654 [Penicillium subrubescens]|uniref:uncharacterized protein n=1 Tax=Penicillium subrubescens TaxID=1316194 RepID=UPI0025454415|nr:uncharacterized protein N7473_000654 [Penicillium subrubescens]KAJ5911351.1 hypothetical protein N7473_000654 [Penicillium subrubescens]
MQVQLPYDVGAFNKLPSLNEAHTQFMAMNGLKVLEEFLHSLFLRYQMTEKFGMTLLHSHFVLNDHEILVEANGTSTPWDLRGADPTPTGFAKYDGAIKPSSWMVTDDHLRAFEFYFDPNTGTPGIDPSVSFVEDLSTILKANNLSNVLGLYQIADASTGQIEVTEGRANVTFPFDKVAHPDVINSDKYIQTSWQFPSTSTGKPQARNWCAKVCIKAHIELHGEKP